MFFANQSRVVAKQLEVRRKRSQIIRNRIQIVAENAMIVGVKSGQIGNPGRHAHAILDKSLIKTDPLVGKTVYIGGFYIRMAAISKTSGIMLIGHDKKNIGPGHGSISFQKWDKWRNIISTHLNQTKTSFA
jgi:hypothetical protein